ncbi:hypothetical protein AG4045_017903 [Apium graveolens]|uniref:Uncharacterized protein n=1 Tax=Apium graveolens TaxID=4045 RepID=A0A6L5B841_APIGR|nr:hypothetical protein AG4045_017903 [Apium graveolens]
MKEKEVEWLIDGPSFGKRSFGSGKRSERRWRKPVDVDVRSQRLVAASMKKDAGPEIDEDFTMQPPAQELVARDLHDNVWTFRHIYCGILAASAHAAAIDSPFTVFFNPRASPSEFVIPLAKYYKAVCSSQISFGMRFQIMFETEESGTRRYQYLSLL